MGKRGAFGERRCWSNRFQRALERDCGVTVEKVPVIAVCLAPNSSNTTVIGRSSGSGSVAWQVVVVDQPIRTWPADGNPIAEVQTSSECFGLRGVQANGTPNIDTTYCPPAAMPKHDGNSCSVARPGQHRSPECSGGVCARGTVALAGTSSTLIDAETYSLRAPQRSRARRSCSRSCLRSRARSRRRSRCSGASSRQRASFAK